MFDFLLTISFWGNKTTSVSIGKIREFIIKSIWKSRRLSPLGRDTQTPKPTWFICGWFDDGRGWCCPLRLIEQLVSLENARPLHRIQMQPIREREKSPRSTKSYGSKIAQRVNHHYYYCTTSFINIVERKERMTTRSQFIIVCWIGRRHRHSRGNKRKS